MRNRGQLHRSIKLLQHHQLIEYDNDYGEYVLRRKDVYARKEEEEKNEAYRRKLWDKIKDEHEFQRAFGTPP